MKSFYEFYKKIQEQGQPQPGAPGTPNTMAPAQAKPAAQGAGTSPPVPPDLGVQSQIARLITQVQNPKLKAALQAAIQQQGQQQQGQPQQPQPPQQAPAPAQPQAAQQPGQPQQAPGQPQPPKPGMQQPPQG